MRNGLARHVKTNIKNTKKQKTYEVPRVADCCYSCKHAQSGYFMDTMFCTCAANWQVTTRDVLKWMICDKFERRE